jgi:hypothetical protein
MSDLKNSPYKTADGVISHPGAPRGGGGSGGGSSVGSPLADRISTKGLIHPDAPAASTWLPQQIADPSLYQRAKCIYQVLELTKDLWPAAVFEETGYQLKGVLQSLIPSLLEMLAVVGLSTVGGAAVGGFIGAFFGGVGAVPGTVVGAQLGAELSTAVLTWLGLGFLIVAIGDGLGELAFMVSDAFSIAWHAAENPQEKKQRVDQAARQLARAIAVLVRLILQGIVAYVLKNAGMASARAGAATVRSATTAGVQATAETSVAEVAGLIRKSKLPDEFALWLEKNWDDLARNPKLRRKTVSQTAKNESGPTTTPSQLKTEMERQKRVADNEESTSSDAVKPKKKTNAEKGVFGESKADEYMENKGFKKLNGNLVKEGDSPKGRGIDGVWENTNPPPDYVITEAKYGSSNLNTLKDGTKQMSPEWIDARLDREVGPTTAAKIRDADLDGSVERWVLKVDEPGNVTKKILLDGEP